MSVGYLINLSVGPVALSLIMTGHEKITTVGVVSGAVINIVLNFLLIPKWGIEGAAFATSISMIIWNVILVIWLYKKSGINSTVLGKTKTL